MLNAIKAFLNNVFLLFIIFITGAAVLILEVTATRILTPYFGNTIYTFSSIISVILLALSLGYFMGGRLADKRGSEFLFYQLIALSGLSVFVLHLINIYIVPQVGTQLSLRDGPLVASILLFLLPGLLLGMLSPLVAKLQKLRLKKQGIGHITGDVFFWSTLGSIVGSLSAGFYLIPNFGVREIIVGVGVALFSIGLLGMFLPRHKNSSVGKVIVLFLTLPIVHLTLFSFNLIRENPAVVYRQEGVYDNIVIYDGEFYGTPARFLQQATDASSAMYLSSDELVYDYTKYYEVYKLINNNAQNALVIGGGAYSIPKALLRDDPNVTVEVAEIEPELFPLGQKYFRVPNDPRLQNHVEDGRRLLMNSDKKYELIFSDAFHFSIPPHLTTKEFFELSKSKLTTNGVFVANVIGSLNETSPSFLFSEIKTFQSVYPNSYFFAVDTLEKSSLQNIIMVGYNGEEGIDLLSVDTTEPFLSQLPSHLIDINKYDLSSHTIFTDDYAPVEYFISRRLTDKTEEN